MASSFETRTFVNGGMLRKFNGQNVSIFLRIEEEAGTNLVGLSTDKQKVRVKLQDSTGGRSGSWVEIIGKPMGSDVIEAKEVFNEGITASFLIISALLKYAYVL